MSELKGRHALVTGAGQGVGEGIATALAKAGANVAVVEINPDTGQRVADELATLGVKTVFIECDVSVPEQAEAAVADTVAAFGGLDILVNNATGARPHDPQVSVLKQTLERFDRMYSIDIRGSYSFMVAAFPHLRASEHGRIINLTSCAGTERSAGFAAYATMKEGLRALTGVTAKEWGKYQITANCICPVVASPGLLQWHADNPEIAQQQMAMVPLGRLGDAETDIGSVVVFLASDKGSYITGQTLHIEGGMTIHA